MHVLLFSESAADTGCDGLPQRNLSFFPALHAAPKTSLAVVFLYPPASTLNHAVRPSPLRRTRALYSAPRVRPFRRSYAALRSCLKR